MKHKSGTIGDYVRNDGRESEREEKRAQHEMGGHVKRRMWVVRVTKEGQLVEMGRASI